RDGRIGGFDGIGMIGDESGSILAQGFEIGRRAVTEASGPGNRRCWKREEYGGVAGGLQSLATTGKDSWAPSGPLARAKLAIEVASVTQVEGGVLGGWDEQGTKLVAVADDDFDVVEAEGGMG